MRYIAYAPDDGIIRDWHVADLPLKTHQIVKQWPPIRVKKGEAIILEFGDVEPVLELCAMIEVNPGWRTPLPFRVVR